MILSIWRYSHLALALSSFVFVLVLSVTGFILALDPISSKLQPLPDVSDFPDRTLGQTIRVLQAEYKEVLNLSVDANGFVSVSVITGQGDVRDFYVHPLSGEKTGEMIEPSGLTKFATNLHRSLFLKSPGRFFVGLSSFLLFLIAVSGLMLIIKRQQGINNFFRKIIKENFLQHAHVYLGRLGLLPLVIITLTGVYLSLLRFSVIPSPLVTHQPDFASGSSLPQMALDSFPVFKHTLLSEVRSVDFPFSDDPSDYYQLRLRQKEVLIHQYSGAVLSEVSYPLVVLLTRWSTLLHTGRGSIVWSVILALSSASILFFMYSGFKMTLKRRASRIRNSYRKNECRYILLVGSETGTTMHFALLFHQQLKKIGIKSFIAQLNDFSHYPKMEQLILFTATYGQGEAPANARKFSRLIQNANVEHAFRFSVIGFGSLAYPDFCRYAFEVDGLLGKVKNAQRLLEPHTVNNRSWESFKQWVALWNEHTGLNVPMPKESTITPGRQPKHAFELVDKTVYGDTFLLTLKPVKSVRCTPGDLLAIHPPGDPHGRLYSLGMTKDKQLLISVKRHEKGICSNYLSLQETGSLIEGYPVKNKHFYFPAKSKRVIMISSGTGIAPFLGMLNQNTSKTETHLYWGGKKKASFRLYQKWVETNLGSARLSSFQPAYSREGNRKSYVQDLLQKDAAWVAKTLRNKGVIMICGSIAMQKGVTDVLHNMCMEINKKPLSFYQKKGQIKMDCY